ncbi:hypothetical protein BDA96_10G106000 [Sorghum bicolor]|uniref:Uncharacterized protein n=1 Tax=Sorghum bicolor TaxID=4558 RepID=A0A921Q332_SORBI|nr:hypothetical protein BDA96_10G106000 [Sorghum bicolor]
MHSLDCVHADMTLPGGGGATPGDQVRWSSDDAVPVQVPAPCSADRNRSGPGPTSLATHHSTPKRQSIFKPPATPHRKPIHPFYSLLPIPVVEASGGSPEAAREMWVFYMISLPLTVGMVAATLRYFAGPAVPAHVLAVVGYAWLCSLSFVVLVPTDIWTVRSLRLLVLASLAPR